MKRCDPTPPPASRRGARRSLFAWTRLGCGGRIYRDGQQEPVLAYHLVADAGSDPVMVDILGLKESQLHGVQEPFGEVIVPNDVDPHHVRRLAEAFLARRKG